MNEWTHSAMCKYYMSYRSNKLTLYITVYNAVINGLTLMYSRVWAGVHFLCIWNICTWDMEWVPQNLVQRTAWALQLVDLAPRRHPRALADLQFPNPKQRRGHCSDICMCSMPLPSHPWKNHAKTRRWSQHLSLFPTQPFNGILRPFLVTRNFRWPQSGTLAISCSFSSSGRRVCDCKRLGPSARRLQNTKGSWMASCSWNVLECDDVCCDMPPMLQLCNQRHWF